MSLEYVVPAREPLWCVFGFPGFPHFLNDFMASATLDYTPSPTIERFLLSQKFYALCMSNRGGGKSTAGLIRAMLKAHSVNPKYHPLRWALIRDTRKNLGLTTARTIRKWCPEPYAKWRGKPEEPEAVTIIVNKKPLVHFDFFGVNSPADHDRFQSYEASGGVWIEEPCPLATNTEFIASGIAESVLASAVTCLRASPAPCVQITMNPPSADHWTAQLWHLDGYEAAGNYELDMAPEQRRVREDIRRDSDVFILPPHENAAERETPGYMERNREILLATGRADLLARLVEGRIGYAQVGERVTPQFNAAHLAPGIQVIPHIPLILAFDYGLNPSCIAAQVSPQGYLLIHRAWTRENVGMKQLLELDVQPWLAAQPTENWWYCGGPEATEREQSNSEETALRTIVQTLGPSTYKSGPVSWSARREALQDGLSRTPGGIAWVRINPQYAALLVRALDGGWYYPTDALGRVRNESVPEKGRFSHLGDAFSHLLAVLLRKTDRSTRLPSSRSQDLRSRNLPASRAARESLTYGTSRTGV